MVSRVCSSEDLFKHISLLFEPTWSRLYSKFICLRHGNERDKSALLTAYDAVEALE